MNAEDYATNDSAHNGACLTPADIAEQDERDRLVAAIRAELNECPQCGHSATHGKYGCERERGDAWIDGVLVARGPCGCTYNEAQEDVLAAARSARAGDGMLFAALRRNGIFQP